MIPLAVLFATLAILNLFRARPGEPVRSLAALLAALADALDLLPHYRRECIRGLVEMGWYFARQWRHYSAAAREAAR